MRHFIASVLLILIFLQTTIVVRTQITVDNLSKIKLLESTKTDLVRLVGQPTNAENPHHTMYKDEDGRLRLSVEYSPGPCGESNKIGWNVPEFVVTRLFFIPSKQVAPSKLGLKIKGFIRHEIPDVPGAYEYENEKLGISFFLKITGKVESIDFSPPVSRDDLRCVNRVSKKID